MSVQFNNNQYVSFLTPGIQSGGGLQLSIEDKTFNSTLTYALTGLSGLETEQQMAYKTYQQLTTFLVQQGKIFTTDYSLTGVPYYSDLPAVQQYNVTMTDHCVCVWAQSMFTISASGTMGQIIHCDNTPTLLTVPDCRNIATVTGIDLTDNDGIDLNDNEVATLLRLTSAKLCGFTNNKIVISTYIQEDTTDWTYGIYLRKTPVVDFVPPQVRQPIAFNLFSAVTYATVKQNYSIEPNTGYLGYRFAQNIVDYVEPFQQFNDVLTTYISGFPHIPTDIENSIVQLIPIVQGQQLSGVESMAGGSFKISFGSNGIMDSYNTIMQSLRQYFLSA